MAIDVLTYWITGKNPQVSTQVQALVADMQPTKIYDFDKVTDKLNLSSRYLRSEGAFNLPSNNHFTNLKKMDFPVTDETIYTYNVAGLANGGFAVIYYTSSNILYGQLYTSEAAANGSAFQVASYSNDYYGNIYNNLIGITGLTDGGFVIAWIDTTYYPYKLSGQLYTSAGKPNGARFQISPSCVSVNSLAIVTLTDGGFVIAYPETVICNSPDLPTSLYAQLYTSAGVLDGSAFQICSSISNWNNNPSGYAIASLVNGGFVVTYVFYSSNVLYGQLYSSTGVQNGAAFQIATDVYDNESPSVAALTSGGFVVTYLTYNSNNILYGQLYSSTGTQNGSAFEAITDHEAQILYPVVTSSKHNEFFLYWIQMASDPTLSGLYQQLYTSIGTQESTAFQITNYTSYSNCFVAATLTNFSVVVFDNSGIGLYAQLFYSNGNIYYPPTQFPTFSPTATPTAPTPSPTTTPTAPTNSPTAAPIAPTYAPTPFAASKFFPVVIGGVAGFASLLILCCLVLSLRYRKTKISTNIDSFINRVQLLTSQETGQITDVEMTSMTRANKPYSNSLEEIKQDLLEQAKIIYLTNRSIVKFKAEQIVFFPAMIREVYLLSKYFLTHPSFEAFENYKKFIQDYHTLYEHRQSHWGKYSRQILDMTEFSCHDTLESVEKRYNSQKSLPYDEIRVLCGQNPPSKPLMLLLTLPHLQCADLTSIDQKIAGVTLLHRIVGSQEETPMALLCIVALLDYGATLVPADQEFQGMDITFQSPAHYAKRLNKTRFFAALTNGVDMESMPIPLNASERMLEERKAQAKVERERKAAQEKAEFEEKQAKERVKQAEEERARIALEKQQKARLEEEEWARILKKQQLKTKLEKEKRERAIMEQKQEEYHQLLYKVARSVVFQLFDGIDNEARQALVQESLCDFLKESKRIESANINLKDDPAHIKRRANLIKTLVDELKPKKYLWINATFLKEDMDDELENVIIIWAQQIREDASSKQEEALLKAQLATMQQQLTTLSSNKATLHRPAASTEDTRNPLQKGFDTAKTAAAEEAGKEIGTKVARAAFGMLTGL